MDEIDFDLNNCIYYVAEALNRYHAPEPLCDLSLSSEHFTQTILYINSILKTCCHDCVQPSEDSSRSNQLKLDVFKYLLAKYLDIETCVPSKPLSLDLILSLAIENRLVDTGRILDFCSRQSPESTKLFYAKIRDGLEQRLREKIDLDKTALFTIDLCLDNDDFDLLDTAVASANFW